MFEICAHDIKFFNDFRGHVPSSQLISKIRNIRDDKKETMLASQKQDAMKVAFKDWIFKDQQRRERLVKVYNERFNSIRPREYGWQSFNFPRNESGNRASSASEALDCQPGDILEYVKNDNDLK